MGAEVATHDDLDCKFVIDGAGNLIEVELPVDRVTGKKVAISPRSNGRCGDINAQSIWDAASAQFYSRQDYYLEKAEFPLEFVEIDHEYTDRRFASGGKVARYALAE
jgi:hypothetical protein